MAEQEAIAFHTITLEDRDWIQERLQEEERNACEYTYANNYLWSGIYGVQVAQINGCGVIKYHTERGLEFSYPFGQGDKIQVIRKLRQYCAAQGDTLRMFPLEEDDRCSMLECFKGEFLIEPDRDRFDYVYTTDKLSTLKGRKLHGKRNHIARFMDDGDWSYEKLTADNLEKCRAMAKEWAAGREEKWNEQMEQELQVLDKAFHDYDSLGLVGGVLHKNGEIVAFSIGEPLNTDTMVVHFEKAYSGIQGAYPMINQQFVLHECSGYEYVNREEDTGDMGLRKAKLSYYPDILLHKYRAIESRVVYANERDKKAVEELWQACFHDEESYINLYLKKRFTEENMLVIWEDNRIVSMASFLPVTVIINGERRQARYVYAVATLPQYQGRGLASCLISYAMEKYREPLVLQPADAAIKTYYKKLGFREYCPEIVMTYEMTHVSGGAGQWNMKRVSPTEYKAVRDNAFEGEGYTEWDEKAIAYAIEENELCGGDTFVLTYSEDMTGHDIQLLMYRREDKILHIIETTLQGEELIGVVEDMLCKTEAEEAVYHNMGGMIWLPNQEEWLCTHGFLNLTLG